MVQFMPLALCRMALLSIVSLLLLIPSAWAKPTPVVAVTVQETAFVDTVEALGTLQANESVEITSSVTELVTKVNFDDGQRVEKGTVLLEMDTAEEQAQLEEERSTLEEARLQLARLKPLTKRGVSSEALLDEQQREYKAAQARIEAIKSRINQRRISAPFDGVVGIRNISLGALVQPGTRITTLDDDSLMKLDFAVPSLYLQAIWAGMPIEVTAGAFPDKIFHGTIKSIDSRIDPVTRSVQVRAILANPNRQLRPGLLMRVMVQKNPRQAIVIPEEALIIEGDRHYVMVVSPLQDAEGQTVEKRQVTLGNRQQGKAEITHGLSAGEQIVTHGHMRSRPGQAVTVTLEGKDGYSPLQTPVNDE